jgi:hypothetical protein
MRHIMLDLETMGTSPSAVIASIGAVSFSPFPKESDSLSLFYKITTDWDVQISKGRTIDAGAVKFWLQEDPIAIKELLIPEDGKLAVKTLSALIDFADFVGERKDVCIWGNGADFDNIILGSMYECFGLTRPWSYSRNRCFRTLKNMLPKVTVSRTGTHHNALDDAIYQAQYMQQALLSSDACARNLFSFE